jgi:hypothetical protein
MNRQFYNFFFYENATFHSLVLLLLFYFLKLSLDLWSSSIDTYEDHKFNDNFKKLKNVKKILINVIAFFILKIPCQRFVFFLTKKPLMVGSGSRKTHGLVMVTF